MPCNLGDAPRRQKRPAPAQLNNCRLGDAVRRGCEDGIGLRLAKVRLRQFYPALSGEATAGSPVLIFWSQRHHDARLWPILSFLVYRLKNGRKPFEDAVYAH